MPEAALSAAVLAWPVVVALAWMAGEVAQRWSVPRIATYALVGFACAQALPGGAALASSPAASLLANVAFGLVLFEFACRIDMRWFRDNPWRTATGVLDVALTVVATYALCRAFGATPISSLLIATMAAATSPASLSRLVGELRSSGQVTEHALHLSAFNCVCALLGFKFIVGYWMFRTSGDAAMALSNTVLVLLVSAGVGAAFGSGMPLVLRLLPGKAGDATLPFALAVVVLVGITQALRFPPLVAILAFGLVVRQGPVRRNEAPGNFGALGEVLVVFLFTYVAATVDWQRAIAGVALGASLVVVRAAAKLIALTVLAPRSGMTGKAGILTALAMSPLSTLVVLLVQDTRAVGIDLIDALAPLATATLLLMWIGPLATRVALGLAGEVQHAPKGEPAKP